jgi:DNA polymerase V
MGMPWHQMKDLVKQHGIQYRSSNYTLYGDMSRRVMSVIGQFVAEEDQEVYSIDESFLDLASYPHSDGQTLGRDIKQRVYQWCGLPVCVGIGATKTLAKLANHIAKKNPELGGVLDLTAVNQDRFEGWTGAMDVSSVWGIGRKLTEHLHAMNLRTVSDLMKAEPKRLRERFGVVVERTALELRGIPCLGLDVVEPRQQIIASRSFGGPVYTLDDLKAAVQTFMGRAVHKLRGQGSCAGQVRVWLETNRFRAQDPQYHPAAGIKLPTPTDDGRVLSHVASTVLEHIYRPGFRYTKAGVMLEELVGVSEVQQDLFSVATPNPKRHALMSVLDHIQGKFGREQVGVGHAGVKERQVWTMRQSRLSPSYTTSWKQLLSVNA